MDSVDAVLYEVSERGNLLENVRALAETSEMILNLMTEVSRHDVKGFSDEEVVGALLDTLPILLGKIMVNRENLAVLGEG